MVYFKVRKSSDQKVIKRKPRHFLVAGELYTKKELYKITNSEEIINKHFTQIEVSKNKTYFCFGARFLKDEKLGKV